MDDASSTWQLLAAIGLIALNGFFVAAEIALVKVRPTRLREMAASGHRRAATALHISTHLNDYLAAIQLGITLASIALGWLGDSVIRELLEPVVGFISLSETTSHILAGLVGFSVVSILHTVLGELVPRSVAMQTAVKTAVRCAWPLHAFYIASYPVLWLLRAITGAGLRLFGLEMAGTTDNTAHTAEEIGMIVSASQKQGALDENQAMLMKNALEYSERVAREIMTPRNDVCVLFTDQSVEEAAQYVLAKGFTRYPLCRGEKDQVVGVVHLRDLFSQCCSRQKKSLEEIAREPLIIPETLPLAEVQELFQAGNTHMALVVDEYGTFSGIVTLEDLVEEVFGEFRDEFDEHEPEPIQPTDDGLELEAGMLVEEAFEALGIDDEDVEVEGIDTLGGLVFSMLGDRPSVGDTVLVDGYKLKVAAVDGLRITRVKATRAAVDADSARVAVS